MLELLSSDVGYPTCIVPYHHLSVGGATVGSDADSKDPEDLSRDHAPARRSPHTLVLAFQFWQVWQPGSPASSILACWAGISAILAIPPKSVVWFG